MQGREDEKGEQEGGKGGGESWEVGARQDVEEIGEGGEGG